MIPAVVGDFPGDAPPGSPVLVPQDDPAQEKEEEEEKEEKQLPPLIEAFTKLQDVRPFQNENFSIDMIVQLFANESTDPGKDTGFLDKGDSAEDFALLVAKAFRDAIAMKDPLAIKGVFNTLGQAAAQIRIDTGHDPIDIFERIIDAEFPLERLGQLEGKVFQDIDVGNLIETLFTVDLQLLQQRNIGPDELIAIRNQFKQDLDELEQHISEEGDTFLFGQNTFRMLQDYINSHVDNDQLRQVLLGDIQQVIAANRQKLGIQLGEAPPIITPITTSLTTVLRQDTAESISNVIGEQLREIDRAQRHIDSFGRQNVNRLEAAQRDRIIAAVTDVNIFTMRNQIRNPRTGQIITIATEREDTVAPQRVAAVSASRAKQRVRPVKNAELVEQLRTIAQTLARPVQTFEHTPRRIRDITTGLSREGIIQDLIEMEQRMNTRIMTMLRPRRQLESSVSRRAKFPNIEIRRGQRRIKSINGQMEKIFGAQMREIRIRKEISLAELAKIANMIAMEDGSLEDIHQRALLDVQKGVTTIQEIVSAIMSQQHANSGNDFSLIFVPSNPVGGMFLDGALAAIHTNRMLVSPVGGDIFSSIFNTVGNVVKTVASVPLALASTVFGGELDPNVIQKPLLFNRARKADSAQHGGILTTDMFNQGEMQPEPFISQGGANQTFHIQPFPFGGRIDNTGFIDQSQRNPKFAWGDVPMIALTSFG